MNSIRRIFIFATSAAALGVASVAIAGVSAPVMQQLKERNSGNDSSQSQPAPAPAPRAAPSAPPSSSPGPARSSEPSGNFRTQDPRAQQSDRPRSRDESAAQRPDNRNNEARGNSRGVIGNVIERRFPEGAPGNGNNGGNGNGNGGGRGNHDHDDRGGNHHRPPRTVYVLPPVYQDYYWNGSRYYNFDGGWYSPYGGSYVSVGTPYGLFVRTLPGYSSSFYYGNTRYYYNDDTYYTYEATRGGYVVAPSPYGDRDDASDAVDEDLYVYPAKAQSEQQQADDRYACHKWAVKETGYDPIDDDYDRDRRAAYTRAITACLTGRGYSVK